MVKKVYDYENNTKKRGLKLFIEFKKDTMYCVFTEIIKTKENLQV